MKMYSSFIKPIIDGVLSVLFISLLSPLLLFIIVGLFLANGKAGVFFIQERPGKDGQLFKMLKFKTMNDEKDSQGKFLPDKDRLTSFGKWIRSTSLDEVPQLINVVKGEMSLVGPRPLLVKYLPLYGSVHAKRHKVRPGITGWAQINGRNAISWEQRLDYDVWYVDHFSFWLDLKIMFITIVRVFCRKDISSANCVTMEEYKGSL